VFLPDLDLLLKIGTAVVCGGAIGVEREFSHKPAGLRTNILICVGSTIFTVASLAIMGERGAPGRIAAQIVTGVGFLGAGTIIQGRGGIHGLTSAATIWVVAAIGILIGLDRYLGAVSAAAIVIAVLWLLRKPEEYIGRRLTVGRLRIVADDSGEVLERIAKVFHEHTTSMDDIRTSRTDEEGRVAISIGVPIHKKGRKELEASLRRVDGVHSAKETIQ